MKKYSRFIKQLPKKLFYNKQTSVALLMAVGATAAYGTMAAPSPSYLDVLGTGSYPLTMDCQTARHKDVPTERFGTPDAQAGIRFRLMTSRSVGCHVTAGSLRKDVTLAPGERAALDFSK